MCGQHQRVHARGDTGVADAPPDGPPDRRRVLRTIGAKVRKTTGKGDDKGVDKIVGKGAGKGAVKAAGGQGGPSGSAESASSGSSGSSGNSAGAGAAGKRSGALFSGIVREKWFWLCVVGLTACLVLFGEGTAFSRYGMPITFSVVTTTDPLSGGWAITVTFLVLAVLSGPASRSCQRPWWLATSAVLSAVGTFLLLAGQIIESVPEAAGLAGGILLGVGSTCMLVAWAELVIPFGARVSSIVLAFAFALTVLFDCAASGLNEVAELVTLVILCAVSPLLLKRSCLAVQTSGPAEQDLDVRGVVPAWASLATLALFGAMAGLIQGGVIPQLTGVSSPNVGDVGEYTRIASDVGVACTAVAIAASARFLRGNNMAFYRWTVLALLALISYLSAVLPATMSVVVTVLMTVARMLMFAYVWALFSTPARSTSPVRLFSVGWLLFLVPNTSATRLGLWACGDDALCLAGGVAVAVLLAALFAVEFAAGAVRGGYLLSDEDSAWQESGEALARRAKVLAASHGLTPREAEVLLLLLQGRSKSFIADTLLISGETVRTHTQHVYQKLDVHSREELVERARE